MGAIIQIGADIGQRVDPTAIVVSEVLKEEDGTHYEVRHIERLMLDTPYPQVVARLVEIHDHLKTGDYARWQERMLARYGAISSRAKYHYTPPQLNIDATGVGQPVVDLLKEAGLRPIPVYLTGGQKELHIDGEIHLAKALLVSNLQVLLQTHRVHLPDTAEARALTEELLNYEIKITEALNLQMGVFTTGAHDDLATALGLACRPQEDRRIRWMPQPYVLTTDYYRKRHTGALDND